MVPIARGASLPCAGDAHGFYPVWGRSASIAAWTLSVVTLVMLLAVSARAQTTTGEWVDYCAGANWEKAETVPESVLSAARMYCVGYVAGAVDVYTIFNRNDFCLRQPGISDDKLTQTLLRWIAFNPEELKQSVRASVLRFLIEMYPCPKDDR